MSQVIEVTYSVGSKERTKLYENPEDKLCFYVENGVLYVARRNTEKVPTTLTEIAAFAQWWSVTNG